MASEELFMSGDLLSGSESDEILLQEASEYAIDLPPEPADYTEMRRRLIGPMADITHPEFGRPNLPKETYGIFYMVREQQVGSYDPKAGKIRVDLRTIVHEYVIDHEDNLVN